MPYRTKDQVASEFIAEGKRRGITQRGIVICIATGLVESNLTVYANAKVPESMALPHDAVGSDGMSVGPLQQQVRKGSNGQWWWGDTATCMDPTKSAGLFYDRLARIDYNGPNSPGSYAQAIQQSAFPDRYDQRMGEAQQYYDRLSGAPAVTDPNRPDFNEIPLFLSGNSNDRDVNDVDLWLLHTQEPPEGSDNRNDAALELRNFLESTKGGSNPVSYHYTGSMANDGGTTVIDCVDTDEACWAVGNSNDRSINFCFAGSRKDWTRQEWLDNEHGSILAAAYLFVQDCKKYPKLKARVIAPNYSNPPGAADHNYCTVFLKDGNNHTDVGPNFPWDVFTAAVNKYASGAPITPTPGGPPVSNVPDYTHETWDQVRGRWAMLGGKTLVEAVAQIRDKVCGTSDAGKPGVEFD
jgi:hypothetical protein